LYLEENEIKPYEEYKADSACGLQKVDPGVNFESGNTELVD